ncbi:2-succinyl-5-enolpyruvyl-6-hydroxy-3-cyclohexene-1-carboxylic-acid synthase [Fructilactobacillus myrtifloralis]|uniref:2-succinyl-5-enolpyruvyl-6-hydroxy-3-cyclohexene-1-carboxylate synthase n=1 Tax=Fructilactobacillus myrtifloralis TaxID=2940301 RepID=A0ABY5BLL6_9LACO|nr:2-succinyl-5-enolpyruvyl-6-hydroxy-3-cyclohexene-1-carboxylic-acid synthase [Fructilactobacillus myrtifloralis]USS84568.1 2-succinyl-5-enolpyruvyl-6-hydroxy-3-cyclohexene-1-carboxylic-acid synthase [Fructilactobacillus myrtifloralis]
MIDVMTNNLKHLISACQAQEVTDFVLSPGSRNTPLALLLAERQVRLTVAVDERSAAFCALGIAKRSHAPVALIATSGTATANYWPAIAEAQSFHVPLVVLTTDRPQELQAIGAPQTIPQRGMYTTNVKQALEINVQDPEPDVTEFIDYQVQQLVHQSQLAPTGPVHLNLPFRKPLLPTLGTAWPQVQPQEFGHIVGSLASNSLTRLVQRLHGRKLLFFLGPNDHYDDPSLLDRLAQQLHAPIIADVLSSLRGTLATTPTPNLQELPQELWPEVVLRFGGTPVNATLLPWLKQHRIPVIQIGANYLGKDHSRWAHTSYNLTAADFCRQLLTTTLHGNPAYRSQWHQAISTKVRSDPTELDGATLPQLLATEAPLQQLFLANSLTVRYFDQAFMPKAPVRVQGNRGANGIDGTISSATGMALNQVPTWLVTGDLAFFHDLNGLQLARTTHVNLTIIVVNNDGGGIFSLLPQATAPHFETLFGTPQHLNLAAAAELVGADYHLVTTRTDLQALVRESWTGLRLLEIRTTRTQLPPRKDD